MLRLWLLPSLLSLLHSVCLGGAISMFACDAAASSLSTILKHDRVEDLLENETDSNGVAVPVISRLEEMQSRGLESGSTSRQPWSDSYWPLYKGGVAARYALPDFDSGSRNWHFFEALSDRAVETDLLSPIEKYELVLGINRHPLSASMWQLALSYEKKYGEVEDWIGICNGWAYASDRLPRPRHVVELRARGADEKYVSVAFFPSDIKALGSFLWSKRNLPFRFIGRRCYEKNPTRNSNGRVDAKYPDCLDTNPATWHKALVNQVGLRQHTFVFDANYDYETWNYPVRSYRYSYFNPETGGGAATLVLAKKPVGFKGDKFAAHRSPETDSIVGISMEVTYIDEIDPPTHARTNSEADDKISTSHFEYDLELDKQGQLIGGEWHQSAHPDFLWTISPATHATSHGDSLLTENWLGRGPVPQSWTAGAQEAAESGELLPAFVETLFSLSQ